ncbi:MAG: HIT domain-containing protein [Actinobacteria bacterium]|nr:HIT domain-containing protein [Actinomycetota bacterium]
MCVFCDIVSGEVPAAVVYENDAFLGFLDIRPLIPGHVLVIPRDHLETLADLSPETITHLFTIVQRVSAAVEDAMGAKGTFVALNNKVSQSVPHVHVHVVPRNPKDGLRGFFWPRHKYKDDAHMEATAASIRAVLEG